MVRLTAKAINAVQRFLSTSEPDAAGLRVIISVFGRGRLHYGLRLEQQAEPTDQVIDYGTIKLFIDRASVSLIDDATIDFIDDSEVTGFRFTEVKPKRDVNPSHGSTTL